MVEVMVVLLIIAILIIIFLALSASARNRAIAMLKKQVSGMIKTPPPATVSSPVHVQYQIVLTPSGTTVPLTASSPFHTYLAATVTFKLVGAGGATFLNGSRSYTMAITPEGLAGADIVGINTNGDKLVIDYTIMQLDGSNPTTITDPGSWPFETDKP